MNKILIEKTDSKEKEIIILYGDYSLIELSKIANEKLGYRFISPTNYSFDKLKSILNIVEIIDADELTNENQKRKLKSSPMIDS